MRNLSLEEKVKRARAIPFKLPPKVSSQKTLLPEGRWAYVYRHEELGNLGRIVLLPHANNQTQFVCEVAGDPGDPMTKQRQAVLEPITKELLNHMESILGKGQGDLAPYTLKPERLVVKSEIMPCEVCKKPVAMLVLAMDAYTEGDLEDYARLMFTKIKELNVPTWVVGAEKEVIINGDYAGEALVLKCWPTREKAKIIHSTILNPILDELMNNHCA
ncbi:MAG: hypothetical protein ACYC2U_08330 [Candidatus Amoebophilus sp.]